MGLAGFVDCWILLGFGFGFGCLLWWVWGFGNWFVVGLIGFRVCFGFWGWVWGWLVWGVLGVFVCGLCILLFVWVWGLCCFVIWAFCGLFVWVVVVFVLWRVVLVGGMGLLLRVGFCG